MQFLKLIFIFFSSLLLSNCLGGLWTGASVLYDRHSLNEKLDDLQLASRARDLLRRAGIFVHGQNSIDLCVFNQDLLIAGHVSNQYTLDRIQNLFKDFKGYRRILIKINVDNNIDKQEFSDAWISTKIRSQMMMDSTVNPKQFKIMTVDGTVYIMGDVMQNEANIVIDIAKNTQGVLHVITWMRYYTLKN